MAEKKEKTNWDKLDVAIEHVGRAITLPAEPGNMPLDKAIEALIRKRDDENQEFQMIEWIDAYPLDAAVAFVKAMTKLYGWASPKTVMTFFGPRPPSMLSIKTGPGLEEVVQCPMGAFKLPGVDKDVHTQISNNDKGQDQFVVHSKIQKKNRHILLELVTEARRIVREESIYRGKSIRLAVSEAGQLDTSNPPQFLDVSDTTEASLIFDDVIQAQIDTNILVPIKETATCRKHKIPLKRGILLEGPYGTGKSLTARMTANICQQNGWTFVLLDKVQGLRVALEFANRYAPAVVFAEDIDRIAEDRDESTNDLINTIDGVVSKKSEIMTILTTNFVEKLNPVILRPGRLDAVISLRPPRQEAVERLLRSYAGRLLPVDCSLAAAVKELAGQIPASIRECVERAKLGMIGRQDDSLRDVDLVTAALTMKNHLALLNKGVKTQTNAEKLAESLHAVVSGNDVAETLVDRLHETVFETDNRTKVIRRDVKEIREKTDNMN